MTEPGSDAPTDPRQKKLEEIATAFHEGKDISALANEAFPHPKDRESALVAARHAFHRMYPDDTHEMEIYVKTDASNDSELPAEVKRHQRSWSSADGWIGNDKTVYHPPDSEKAFSGVFHKLLLNTTTQEAQIVSGNDIDTQEIYKTK